MDPAPPPAEERFAIGPRELRGIAVFALLLALLFLPVLAASCAARRSAAEPAAMRP
ncbi:MAG: hypothetical protein HUU15_17185 [Candidatus Brocadiae bacterium]|nr:hypothetical protein [Candidatus Brocadiia bacterium]